MNNVTQSMSKGVIQEIKCQENKKESASRIYRRFRKPARKLGSSKEKLN